MTAFDYLFAFVVLLGILIFVHELGHFLVAKLCGVRVLKFSLGFGNPIGFGRHRLRWKRGHTEYVVAWFPLGGFVKMLGEQPEEEDTAEVRAAPEEALNHKPYWQKLAIVFAGPGMNLLLPVVVFAGTLFVGIPRPDAVVGMVERGSPAAEAGLRPGDRIEAVEGRSVRWWEDVDEAIRRQPGEDLSLTIARDGKTQRVELPVRSRTGLDAFGTVAETGWVGLGHRRQRAVVGIPDASSPAARAELRSGDLVTAVAGEPVEDWHGFATAYAEAGDGEVTLTVERGPPDDRRSAQVAVPALADASALGVVPANVLVSGVSEGSPAARAGLQPGDLILAVDGEPVGSFASFAGTVRSSEGRTLHLTYARDGERHRVEIAPELVPTDVGLGIEEPRYLVGITAEPAVALGTLTVDRERNPFVAVPRAAVMTVEVTGTFLTGLWKLATGEVSRRQLAGPIGIAQIAGESMRRGWETFLSTLVLISINLGILNLLPIPILDGGQALLFTVEKLKRGPLSLRTKEVVQQIGLTVLVLLMGVAFWNDLSRFGEKFLDWLRGAT